MTLLIRMTSGEKLIDMALGRKGRGSSSAQVETMGHLDPEFKLPGWVGNMPELMCRPFETSHYPYRISTWVIAESGSQQYTTVRSWS